MRKREHQGGGDGGGGGSGGLCSAKRKATGWEREAGGPGGFTHFRKKRLVTEGWRDWHPKV